MGRVLIPRALGNADHASEQGAVIASLRSVPSLHFTSSLAKNAMETESIEGLLATSVLIRRVGIFSKQPLLLRLLLFADSGFTDADIASDNLLSSLLFNLPDLGQLVGVKQDAALNFERLYTGIEGDQLHDAVLSPSGYLLRVYTDTGAAAGIKWQRLYRPGETSDFSTWETMQGGDASYITRSGRCDWGWAATGQAQLFVFHQARFSGQDRLYYLSMNEDGTNQSIAQCIATGFGSNIRFAVAFDHNQPAAGVGSNAVLAQHFTTVSANVQARTKDYTGTNFSAATTLSSGLYDIVGIDVVHNIGNQWVIFYIADVDSSTTEYAIYSVTFDYVGGFGAPKKIYSSNVPLATPFIEKLKDVWRLQFNENNQQAALVSPNLLGDASSWSRIADLSLWSQNGVAIAYQPPIVWLSTGDGVWRSTDYQMVLSGLALPYRDAEGLKRLHIGVANLSPTSKAAYPQGEVILDVAYQRLG